MADDQDECDSEQETRDRIDRETRVSMPDRRRHTQHEPSGQGREPEQQRPPDAAGSRSGRGHEAPIDGQDVWNDRAPYSNGRPPSATTFSTVPQMIT